MELRHLRYFNEIANELSFSRAALNLHIAQPALSARIRDLEAELGVTLFRRLGSRIELTGPGEVFHGHVRQLLESLGHAVRLTQRAQRAGPASLTIGFIGSASYSFLPWVKARDLAGEAFVMFPPGERAGFHYQVVMICQSAGFAPRIAQYAAPMQNVIGLVGAGLGVSIVPAAVAKIVMPEVCYRPFDGQAFFAETAVAWNRTLESPTRAAFLEIARSVAANVPPAGAG